MFLSQEGRLDVLWNNAGVMKPPTGTRREQVSHPISSCNSYIRLRKLTSIGLRTSTRNQLPWTILIHSTSSTLLVKTATSSPPNTVRVTFTGSLAVETNVPESVIYFNNINMEKDGSQTTKYGQSKARNIFLEYESGKRMKDDGLVCVVSTSSQHILRWNSHCSNWNPLRV